MKFFSEDEVRKLIEETDIHDGIRGTADDYLPIMKGIELPDKHGRLIDLDKRIKRSKYLVEECLFSSDELLDDLEATPADEIVLEATE